MGGGYPGIFDGRCAPRLRKLLLRAAFWQRQYEQEHNERLTMINWGRIVAAKPLLCETLIAVKSLAERYESFSQD